MILALAPLRRWVLAFIAPAGCVVTGEAGQLSDSESGASTSSTAATSSTTSAPSTGATDVKRLDLGSTDLPSVECASVGQSTKIEERPSDILVVVDRVMNPANTDATFLNFAQAIRNYDLDDDIQVAMLAGYPPDGVCIDEAPLGVEQCPDNDHNPPTYRRVEEVITGEQLLDQVLDTYDRWSGVLRANSRKHVWVVASRDATMPVADFDAALRARDPRLREYTFHAIAPDEAIGTGDCTGGVAGGASWAPAPAYAALAADTGGAFQNACDYNLGPLFDDLLGRIQDVALACEYNIPPAPAGHVFEQGKVNVDYDDGFAVQTVGYVAGFSDCPRVTNGWYYDDNATPRQVLMCPQTCARFEALDEASIEIRFGCATQPAE